MFGFLGKAGYPQMGNPNEHKPAIKAEDRHMTKIFIVEDNEVYATLLQHTLESEDKYDIHLIKSADELFKKIHLNPDIVTIDYNLPDRNGLDVLKEVKNYNKDIQAIILSGQERVDVVVECYNHGASSYIIKNDNTIVELTKTVENLSKNVNLRKEVDYLREQIIDRNKYNKIIGDSPAVLKVLRLIQKVEKTNMLALITGESGTGKELAAASIHYNSPRAKMAYVLVNMAAIPEDLIESELFGHEKGAFTGADSKRIGKFEEANGGTIFLDEIGEMNMHLQTKLLRVLQENKIMRLGSNKEIQLDVRVIAATNKNLAQRVKDGKMREDLYYRLQGFLIHLPPLRERENDTIMLAKHFLKEFCDRNKLPQKTFSPQAIQKITTHTWPGNIRELKALVERTVLICDDDIITPDDMIFSALI
ncbi:MAG: sigma-54-dependent transcriptional regulator [Bacteroidota bacterium]|jgi:DNA-binding NtrC family response regulator|nr:acetoacetate metabolism regulatory protein AtoC [Bacteroidota bacterium]